jgi:hypothetical protein
MRRVGSWLLSGMLELEIGVFPSRSCYIFISMSDTDKAFSDMSTWQPPSRVCSPSPARVAVSDRHVGMAGRAFAIGGSATADADFVFGDLDMVRYQPCSHSICSQVSLRLSLQQAPHVSFWIPVSWVCGCLLTAAHACLVYLVDLEGRGYLSFRGIDKSVGWPMIGKQLPMRLRLWHTMMPSASFSSHILLKSCIELHIHYWPTIALCS